MQVATIAALLIAIGFTRIHLRDSGSFDVAVAEQERVELQEIVQTAQETLPPPPPRPAVPVAVADDEILEEDVLDLDASLDLTERLVAAASPPPIEKEEQDAFDEREVFVVVEEQPEMIGGAASLAAAVEYPMIARQAGLEGMVVVKIIVTADGHPSEPTILRSPSDVLNKAAVDAVMEQRFKPGRQRGRPVAVVMAIPVRFQLTQGA